MDANLRERMHSFLQVYRTNMKFQTEKEAIERQTKTTKDGQDS